MTEPRELEPQPDAEPVASTNGAVPPPEATAEEPDAPSDPGDVALLGLIDRLAALLDRSELSELEVQVGGTGVVLRKPSAIAPPLVLATGAAVPGSGAGPVTGIAGGDAVAVAGSPGAATIPSRPAVLAPLTGIWYAAPSAGSAPYVTVGGEVASGQVICLIEAMKLFNEIKSDLSGRIVRIHAENGKLVKARQPLIEVEPL